VTRDREAHRRLGAHPGMIYPDKGFAAEREHLAGPTRPAHGARLAGNHMGRGAALEKPQDMAAALFPDCAADASCTTHLDSIELDFDPDIVRRSPGLPVQFLDDAAPQDIAGGEQGVFKDWPAHPFLEIAERKFQGLQPLHFNRRCRRHQAGGQ
jgi:hypothetical protein